MSPAPVKWTASALLDRLRRHYIAPGVPLPGGVFVPEVTYGAAGGSRCDAVYIGFTATSGRVLIGHEVKVTRGDWLRELEKRGKADRWADECHAFYVVAPSPEIVQPDELPPGWGLLTADGNTRTRLRVARAAHVDAARCPSWDAVRSIFARLDTLRANDAASQRALAENEALAKVRKVLQGSGYGTQLPGFPHVELRDRVSREIAARDAQHAGAPALLASIEQALGLKIDQAPTAAHREDTVSVGELAGLRDVLRYGRDALRAAESLVGRWASPTRELRRGLDDVEQALDALRILSVAPAARDCGILPAEDEA